MSVKEQEILSKYQVWQPYSSEADQKESNEHQLQGATYSGCSSCGGGCAACAG